MLIVACVPSRISQVFSDEMGGFISNLRKYLPTPAAAPLYRSLALRQNESSCTPCASLSKGITGLPVVDGSFYTITGFFDPQFCRSSSSLRVALHENPCGLHYFALLSCQHRYPTAWNWLA